MMDVVHVGISRILLLTACVLVVGCDAGKAPYNEGVALEEKGQLAEAAEKYDAVCRRAPDSKMCAPSVGRAGAARIKLAEAALTAFKFGEAEAVLNKVGETGDRENKTKAKGLLDSNDVTQGLAWEKAAAMTDKAKALPDMEKVAASGASTAGKANEWLAKERPALLLTAATQACTPKVTSACGSICERLVKLHPTEADKVKDYLVAVKTADDERLYPLLVEAEKLLQEMAKFKKASLAQDACLLPAMAANPDNVMAAMAACPKPPGRSTDLIETDWNDLLKKFSDSARVSALQARWKLADEEGKYDKQEPKKPDSMAGQGVK